MGSIILTQFSILSSDYDKRCISGRGGTAPLESVGPGTPRHFVRRDRLAEKVQDGEFAKEPGYEEIEFRHRERVFGRQHQRRLQHLLLLLLLEERLLLLLHEMALMMKIVTMMVMMKMIIKI